MAKRSGFTLIELMIVVAIVAFLSMIAVPRFTKFLAKAKRAEAYMNLGSIYTALKIHWAENNTYTNILHGKGGIGWEPEGTHYYTYGFAGQPGKNYFAGKVGGSIDTLAQAKADKNSFVVVATGYINGEGKADVLTVNEKNEIKVVQDSLN